MRKHADSARLRRLSLHHDCFMKDMMHKVSTDIVRYCVEHKVGTIVMGVNRGWKQGAGRKLRRRRHRPQRRPVMTGTR